jgi:hypothetical protein
LFFLITLKVKRKVCYILRQLLRELLKRLTACKTKTINTEFISDQDILKSRARWLMAVILATQEAEIRRTVVQNQPQENSLQDPISKKIHQ